MPKHKSKDKSATKLEKKVYKQLKTSEKSDEKVHNDLSKVIKNKKSDIEDDAKVLKKATRSQVKKEIKAGKEKSSCASKAGKNKKK